MNILVTGGAGFIGSHLIQKLQLLGHTVVNIDELNDYYDTKFKQYNLSVLAPHQFYQADVCDTAALDHIFKQHTFDSVIHLGGRAGVRHSLQHPELYHRVNFGGTKQLVEMATYYGVRQFIFGSTSAVYGNTTTLPFSETTADLKPVSPYADSKLKAEQLLRHHHDSTGLPITILRFFTVYGERGRPDMAPYLFTEALLRGQPIKKFGDGSSSRDYTYIADIVAGIISALEHPFDFEIINLGNNQAVSLHTFITTLESITGQTANITSLPTQPGEVRHTLADITKAQRLLNYHPHTSLAEGIHRFVDWYRAVRL